MAAVWSKTGVGHAVKDVVIRDPVVITASLPRFLAPGDVSSLRLDIANTDAPAGEYQLAINASDAVSVDQSAVRTVRLEAGGKTDLTLPLTGVEPGDGRLTLRLSNASGLSMER